MVNYYFGFDFVGSVYFVGVERQLEKDRSFELEDLMFDSVKRQLEEI